VISKLPSRALQAAGLALLLCAGPAVGASAGAPGAGITHGGETPLRSLLGRATTVALGRAGAPTSYDDGRLLVHPLRIERVLRGAAIGDVADVVEMLGSIQRPPLLAEGERAVVLLEKAKTLSYYDTHLPDGPRFEPVAGRDGVVPVASEQALEATESLFAQAEAASAAPAEEQPQALRALAFAAAETRQPRWVADAILELRVVPQGAELTTEEVSILSGVLRDTGVPPPLRVRLLHLLADRRWQGAKDVVAVTSVDEPSVFDALLDARARLGVPAGLDELKPHLASNDPRIRAAAVRALATVDDPKAVPELGRFATTDRDAKVQETAIDALGRTDRDDAVPWVKKTFATETPAIRQASARALVTLGGKRKNDALLDLALTSDDPNARHYAAVVLLVSSPSEDPAVRRLRAEATDPKIQRLFEHGLELKAHRHDD